MSFLADVLKTAEKVDLEHLNENVPVLHNAVETLKFEIETFLEKVYVKFAERPTVNANFLNKARKLEQELNTLSATLNRGLGGSAELISSFEKHSNLLQKTNYKLDLIQKVGEIHELLRQLTNLQHLGKYVELVDTVGKLKDKFDEISTVMSLVSNPLVITKLKEVIQNKELEVILLLKHVFEEHCILIVDNSSAVLKFKNHQDELREVLVALYKFDNLDVLMQIAKFLWDHCFVPVVESNVEVVVNEGGDYNVLKIQINDSSVPTYNQVFSNIQHIVAYLKAHFYLKLDDDLSTLKYIGEILRDNLSELLIKRCLQNTIPSSKEELIKYNTVIDATEILESFLKDAEIFTDETTSVYEYVKNADTLFINKKCQTCLKQAEEIMKKDLHEIKEVGITSNNLSSIEVTEGFPRCTISVSAERLLTLCESILREALDQTNTAPQLVCTIQKILLMYVHFVPEYHKKLLQTIPQQVGLFHNNCKYLAFNLRTWNEKYLEKLSGILPTSGPYFKHEIFELEKVSDNLFKTFVEEQIEQIKTIMKEADLDNRQILAKLEPTTEKHVRQCLRQQELLKTVWQKVLRYEVYNKTLGLILDSLCQFLIKATLKYEDIEVEGAEQLVDLLKIITNRGPKLFTDPKEIHIFVPSWYKFNELIFVLNATLVDIDDRWADGKGPLALQFKPSELRSLIKALFQNTDRRAALLSKIRD